MRHRPIAKTSKTGTITKRQARKAAVAAKSVAHKTKTVRKTVAPASSILERYLGHFGSRESSNDSSDRNGTGKSSAGRKGFRRAS
jgi:hypothetical protein